MIEPRRIIEIYVPADSSVGSGYVLTSSLVLTARHVVDAALTASGPLVAPGDDGVKADLNQLSVGRPRCRVRSLGSPPGTSFSDAVVVWWASDADVALLAVVAGEALTAPPVPGITWSDLLDGDPVEVTAVGFPDAVVEGDVRESRQIVGRVAPLSGVKAGRWVIHAEGSIGAVPVGSISAWAGMSGAAVFAGDCLIGIVEVDADPDRPERLELWALPARKFASDPGLAGWLRWDGGVDAWAMAPSPPAGALALLRQVAEANEHVRVLSNEVLLKLREALAAQRDAIDDQRTRRAVAKVLAMLHSKNVLYAGLDAEIWEYVFASLRELRASFGDAYAELVTSGPRSVAALVDAMLTATREYLAVHGASYERHMREMPGDQSVAHWEREWPDLRRAAVGLLALREVLMGAIEPLNAYAAPDEELHLVGGGLREWELSQSWTSRRSADSTVAPDGSPSDDPRNARVCEGSPELQGHEPSHATLQELRRALDGEIRSVRIAAIHELATIGSTDAVTMLASALYAGDHPVSAAALAALRGMNLSPEQMAVLIIDPVVEALSEREVRADAVEALGSLAELDLPPDEVATRIIEPLTDMLGDDDEHVRACTVQALSRFVGVAALPVGRLIEALAHNPDGPTRMTAARMLGDLKAREAVTALSHSLLDEDQFVRAAAAYALADIADPEALASLRRALMEPDESTKHEAVGGYGSTRSHVANALSKMHTDEAFAALEAAVSRDPCDRDVIIAVANSFDPRAIPALEAIAANRDVPHDLHERVTQALRSLRHDRG